MARTEGMDAPDDVPFDGSEPGNTYFPGPALTLSEKSSLVRRPDVFLNDEVELRPLPPLQQSATTGRDFKPTQRHALNGEATCIAVNPGCDIVAVGCIDSRVLLMDAKSLAPMAAHDLSGNEVKAITAMQFRPDGQGGHDNVAVMAQSDGVLLVHTSTGRVLSRREELDNCINTLALRPGAADRLATAGSDTLVRVYDESRGELLCSLSHGDGERCAGHSSAIYSVVWKPDDPQVLLSGGWDKTVQVWDLRLRRSVRSLFGPYLCGDALDVAPSGDLVLTGSCRHASPLETWDFGSGRLVTRFAFHQPKEDACMLYCAKFGAGPLEGCAISGGGGVQPCLRQHLATGELQGQLTLASSLTGLATLFASRTVIACCTGEVILLEL
ncbi:WD40-repeat-containing domain protein [Haematococcus lacustris]